MPHGKELLAFVEAVVGATPELPAARAHLRHAIGAAAFVDTCATVASFNAVVKIADGTGIPLEDWKAERTQDIRATLGIDDYRS